MVILNTNDWWNVCIMDKEKFNLSVFVDESGSITKTDISHNKYFIIVTFFCCDEHHNLFLNQFIMYLN